MLVLRSPQCNREVNLSTEPSPTVMGAGLGHVSHSQYYIEPQAKHMSAVTQDKPPYRVPLLSELSDYEPNGMKVASTFAGCGGSSIGYRMAGYDVTWVNEYDEHALDCYHLNSQAGTHINGMDIHDVTPAMVLDEAGLEPGELDVFDGSPPCQTFSTSGNRNMQDPRSTLFFEYIRLLRGLKPRAFIAENVSGMVKGVAKGYFKLILAELKKSGYRVQAKLLDAQWLGVPQKRQRLVFIGFRDDLGIEPAFPKPLPYRYSVRDACPWITRVVQDTSGIFKTTDQDGTEPVDAITASNAHHLKKETAGADDEAKPIAPSRQPDSYGFHQVDPDKPSATITCASPGNDHAVCVGPPAPGEEKPIKPSWEPGIWGFSQVDPDAPTATITTSPDKNAVSMDGPADTIRPGVAFSDPLRQNRRAFTIAEVKRLMSFPDDFKLTGSYNRQWRVCGNAVPPLMMRAVAEQVRDSLTSA